jgi:tRNA-dihydrouridine synthase 3
MAPMTKGSNLPYRRLCVELGARVTISEMTVARRLKQRRQSEFALIRRFDGEPFFGVQLAGTNAEELGWAAALVESRGADLVDLNCGCPIDHFTRKGIGASLGRQPKRIRRIVESMKQAVTRIPVTVKLRLGWNDAMRNHLDQARAAVDGGADALFVHGRTRNARYRQAADWDAIGEIAAAVSVPVVGNGDLLFPDEIAEARVRSGVAGVMSARGALIKPWLFREAGEGYRTVSAEERLAIYRRYVTLAREHWGADVHGLARVRMFVRWHLDFWHRYAPQHADGSFPRLQARETLAFARTPLEYLLARTDPAAHEYLADALTYEREIDDKPDQPPLKLRRSAEASAKAEGLSPPADGLSPPVDGWAPLAEGVSPHDEEFAEAEG